ncbi:MAG: thiamine diphosphokinase [Ruminococcus sp.]|nr:thiamine diphosphokinase [Ruminococcus sp.]
MKTCFIFGALPALYTPILPQKGDLVIAADRGYLRLEEKGITPDILVADFDSMKEDPLFENTVRLNVRKDFTDVACAVDIGFEKGYDQFVVYGGAGGKLDHSLANVQLCQDILRRGGEAVFYGDNESFTVIRSSFHFEKRDQGRLSVFSVTDQCEGVRISGASYEADGITLYRNQSPTLGVSNAFVNKEVSISVESGELLIIWETIC